MSNKGMKKLTIYITPEAFQKLREKGFKDDVKHTELIRQAIDNYLGVGIEK